MFLYGFELHRLLIIKNLILNLINWFCYSTYVSRRICIDPLKIGDISCYSTYVSRRISIDPLIIGDNCSFQWKTWRLVKWRRNDITSSGTKFKIVSLEFFPSNVIQGPLPEAPPTESDRIRPSDYVGFGRIWWDLVGFSRIRLDSVGFGRIGRIRSDSVGFCRIRSDSVGVAPGRGPYSFQHRRPPLAVTSTKFDKCRSRHFSTHAYLRVVLKLP